MYICLDPMIVFSVMGGVVLLALGGANKLIGGSERWRRVLIYAGLALLAGAVIYSALGLTAKCVFRADGGPA